MKVKELNSWKVLDFYF